jgi:hypothetical protein
MSREAQRRARLAAAVERAMVTDVSAVIVATGRDIAGRIRAGADWKEALSQQAGRLETVIDRGCRRAAAAGASDTQATITKARRSERKRDDAPMASAYVLGWVRRHAAKRVVQISRTTARAIRKQIIEGVKRGWSNDRIATEIEAATGGEIGRKRALRIARTETHTAFERGSYEQAREARAMGIQIEGEWAATEDKRTRPDHALADGQTIELGKRLFVVGGERLRFPGDPRASARQVINCRCVALWRPKG